MVLIVVVGVAWFAIATITVCVCVVAGRADREAETVVPAARRSPTLAQRGPFPRGLAAQR